MPLFVNASNVRAYGHIDGTDEPWSEHNLSSNIRAASAFLEKRTNRQFELSIGTRKFTTNGDAFVALPGLISASSVSLASTAMTADSDYHLIPDSQQTGSYIGIQFRPFGRRADYRSYPDWFDTNKDQRWGTFTGSDPNDLVIAGTWGYNPLPDELLLATKALAFWYTKRPDASLGGLSVTPLGTEVDLSQYPVEVREFIAAWKIESEHGVASVG
jgi:hypothetical protein